MAPFRIGRPRFLAYFAFEGGLIFAVIYALGNLTLTLAPGVERSQILPAVLMGGVAFTLTLVVTRKAQPHLIDRASLIREISLFSLTCLILSLTLFAISWLFFMENRRFFAFLVLEAGVAVPAAVAAWRWISVRYSVLGAARENILIVGIGTTAQDICRLIGSHPASGYAVVGFADDDEDQVGTVLTMGTRIQSDFASLPSYSPRRVDRIIVALDEKRGRLPVRELMELRLRGIEIEDATSFVERVFGKLSVDTMLPSWLIFSEGFKSSVLKSMLKRAADWFLATLLLVLSSPLMLLTAILVRIDSRGPILYRQTRVGRNGRQFDVLKFRSMTADAEGSSGPIWACENDPRITRVGRVLRPLRIDELPQLFNVFRGEMSFVGPRPERPHFTRQLQSRIPYYGLRMTVRPGITGWAQVEYGYGATEEDAREKLKYDLYYIKNSNLLFDLWIVLKTTKVVLAGLGAR